MRSRPQHLDLPLLLFALAAPALPAPFSALALGIALALFLADRPLQREALAVGVPLGLATALLLGAWIAAELPRHGEAAWRAEAATRYAALWQDLHQEGAAAASSLAGAPSDTASRMRAFRRLTEQASRDRERTTLLLCNPDGDAVAWAGEGLLHEFRGADLPRSGQRFVSGWTAVTLLAVEPLDAARRPWRIVAGRTLPTDTLPFPNPEWRDGSTLHWSMLAAGQAKPAPGLVVVSQAGLPDLLIEAPLGSPSAAPFAGAAARRLAWGLVGLALFALATLRGIGLVLLTGTVVKGRTRPWQVVLLAAGAAAAAVLAGSGRPLNLLPLLAGTVLLALASRRPRRAGTALAAAGLGAGAALLAAGAATLWQGVQGSLDLGGDVIGSADVFALRLGIAAIVLGLLAVAGRWATAEEAEAPSKPAWAALLVILIAAVAHQAAGVAWALLALGGALTALWMRRASPTRRVAAAATAILLAALLAAVTWETAYRRQIRVETGALLARLGPPSAAELEALDRDTTAALERLDLARLSPAASLGLDRQDLAIALWQETPLSRPNAISALALDLGPAGESSFAFGLSLQSAETGSSPGRARSEPLPVWDREQVAGEAVVRLHGAAVGHARYWLRLRPGFRLGGERDEDLGAALLRGGRATPGIEGLPPGVEFGLYDADGQALRTPWKESPPLPSALRGGGPATVDTPGGPAWAVARSGADGVEVLFLPRLEVRGALDRVGTHALGLLLALGGAGLVALLLGLPRAAFRDTLRRAVRSYSKRLLIVYTSLLLVPLLLLSVALVRGLEARVYREQRADGEAALASAQQVLAEYLLSLEPGFGLDTALDDRLMHWLSGVVQHDVNLYWGSSVYASSERELFTAGLLPKRIPGEIYSRLTLLGYQYASRVNRTGDTQYLEIYAPLRVAGAPAGSEALLLSMPLLAQQEETAAEIEYLRRQALLGTAALFLLLVAVGSRLARNFTTPLQELVRGTQRIAAGAASLGLQPSELELAALVEAVDRMAGRIAETRERLLREKQVVERVVDNITAGVVSLDAERRVLMHNRVAAALLRVRTGEPLAAALAADPSLQPVADFVNRAATEPVQATVRVRGEGGEREWTLVWAPVPGTGDPAALLVVEDSTEVLHAERLEAWAEMARMIAHEIKNPLTPIRLSAEHMREVWAGDRERFEPVFERCTANILKQVDDLRQIATEFSTYSRIPRLERRPGDLVETVREVVAGYAAATGGVRIEMSSDRPVVPAEIDARMLGRAVRNLLENALRACGPAGTITVRVDSRPGEARITVADDGPGVTPELLARIFEPYFSTHGAGTGLGLPIARRIIEEHGGTMLARNRSSGGLEVVITMPVS